MSLKEDIQGVKEEIGAQEQFLESIIKSERFYKKYKKQILALGAVLILGGAGYTGYTLIKEHDLKVSNEAYEKLIKSPNDSEAMSVLKDKNLPLYKIFLFQEAVKEKSVKKLEELSNDKKSDILADLSTYELGQLKNSQSINSELLKGFSLLEEGFDLLKVGKITEAKLKFAQIDPNSPLSKIVKNLEHFQGKTK